MSSRLAGLWRALETVFDPEIPVVTIVEMGMVAGVHLGERGVRVDLTPTFAGCPAVAVIRDGITAAVRAAGETEVEVRVVYDPPWTTDRLSDSARQKLKQFGLAPPVRACGAEASQGADEDQFRGTPGVRGTRPIPAMVAVPCPYCDSVETQLESLFGPTLCRSIHYCNACSQSFEHFKRI
ncbi:MAG: phenylacetate-CoA oxygenase subunit PaaJ [Planctomycetes bacterium]|nr:phenylacetate-CoA oxygenase subunit PaaJ [Planctomycetota bacterium]